MQIVTATSDLQEICRDFSRFDYVTIDTEFIRDTTYWPKLCLLQVAGPDYACIIDPIEGALDLQPFYDLLQNKAVTKVFHAARQDIEIFYHQHEVIPLPLFDTQVAAMACGFGDSISYDSIVKRLIGIQIDKSSRYTNWNKRPLSEEQLTYAIADVTHMRGVYDALQKQLVERKREHWLREEMKILTDPVTYELNPETAWKRIKLREVARRRLGVLIEVAAWRETQAQQRNVPRNRIMKDDTIHEILALCPKSVSDLQKLRSVPRSLIKPENAQVLIDAVKRGLEIPKNNLPKPPAVRKRTVHNGSLVELLKVLLKLQCERHDVSQKLIATSRDLEDIAEDDEANVPALHGWRYKVFGELALKLKGGEIGLATRNGNATIIYLSKESMPPGASAS